MTTYSIVLDSRERKLIAACKELVIPYKTDSLSLGDIHILDENGIICMMIERKSWQDLASSIIDNRYKEQHARYTTWAKENQCEVWYILEGTKRFRSPQQERRTLSAHLSLLFDSNIRTVETKHPTHTMEWIHSVLKKIGSRSTDWMSSGFLHGRKDQVGTGKVSNEAIELAEQKIHKIGKKQHSDISTWIAMLSCIYGMSTQKAAAIVEWKCGTDLLQWLASVSKQEAIKTLSTIQVTSGNKTRNLGKALAQRITSMFQYIKESEQ